MDNNIKTVLQDFVNARTWQESRQVLLNHEDIILMQTADAVFVSWLTEADPDQVPLLIQYRDILRLCRENGINVTFDSLPISRPINKALKVFIETTPLFFEIPIFLKDYPECATWEFQQAIERAIKQIQSENAEAAEELILARGMLRIAQRVMFLEEEHTKLLIEWLQADTEQSKELLKQNAEFLLSDQALETLDKLIDISEEDERPDITNHQRRRKAILETARSSTIEAAYAQATPPTSFVEVMSALPLEIHSAVEELFDANSESQLVALVNKHPILLSQEVFTALDNLLEAVQNTGQERFIHAIEGRYETLKQMAAAKMATQPFDSFLASLPESLHRPIQAFLSVESGTELNNVVLQYPVLATPLGTSSIEGLIAELRKSKLESALLHVTSRYTGLKQLISLNEVLEKSLHETPDVVQKIIRNLLDTNNENELVEQVQWNPILLTSKILRVIEKILIDLRQAGLQDFARSFEFRYSSLKRIAGEQPELSNSLDMVSDDLLVPVNALFAVKTIDDISQVALFYPMLLSDQGANLLNQLISDWSKIGQGDLARKLEERLTVLRDTAPITLTKQSLSSLGTSALIERIGDEKEEIRRASLEILSARGNQGDTEAARGILDATCSQSWLLRMLAFDTLIEVGARVQSLYLEQIETASQRALTRSAAMIILSLVNEPTFAFKLPSFLESGDVVLRLASVICLEIIDNGDGIDILNVNLKDEDVIIRTVVQDVLAGSQGF